MVFPLDGAEVGVGVGAEVGVGVGVAPGPEVGVGVAPISAQQFILRQFDVYAVQDKVLHTASQTVCAQPESQEIGLV